MSNELQEIAGKLGTAEAASKQGTVAVWGKLLGTRGDDLVIMIGESEYLIRPGEVEKFKEVETSDQEAEVFLLVDSDFEFRTTAKNIAVLAGTHPYSTGSPFALARPEMAPAHEHSEQEMRKFEEEYADWRRRVGLFEEFVGDIKKQCTLTNTKLTTSCGIMDKGICPDGSQGDGCEGY